MGVLLYLVFFLFFFFFERFWNLLWRRDGQCSTDEGAARNERLANGRERTKCVWDLRHVDGVIKVHSVQKQICISHYGFTCCSHLAVENCF